MKAKDEPQFDKDRVVKRIRIALWKLRYGLRVYRRSKAPDMKAGTYLLWCLGECADMGWALQLDEENNDVEQALAESPVWAADEELSNWDPA